MKKRTYILDTNVILFDAQAILKFQEHDIVLPITTIEELDHFKKEMNELGRNARFFSNLMDELRETGSLKAGVKLNELGAILRVMFAETRFLDYLPEEFERTLADNKILAVALACQASLDSEVILVTKDINLRLKADCLGVKAETYENGQVDFDDLYTGRQAVHCSNISEYKEPKLFSEVDLDFAQEPHPNEFITLVETHIDGDDTLVCRYQAETNDTPEQLFPLRSDLDSWGLTPRNDEQKMAMDLLLDDDIKLVVLIGKAGVGKTLLALAAALRKVTDEFVYRKVLVSRPVYPMGKDIGFLPGDINEKLAPYMQPIYDNLEYLISGTNADGAGKVKKTARKVSKKEQKVEEEKEVGNLGSGYLELQAAGIIQVEPLLYIRGRSIPKQFLIVDEAQNLSRHAVKTIVTRAGEGTKIVFTGDPSQIDDPFLDASSNGLTYLVDKFKSEKIAGCVTLVEGVRSELAEIASNIL